MKTHKAKKTIAYLLTTYDYFFCYFFPFCRNFGITNVCWKSLKEKYSQKKNEEKNKKKT